MTPGEQGHRVVVRRVIAATREELFDAWLDEEGMREWMCPGETISSEVHLEPRVGGRLLIVMKTPTESYEHTGEFQVIERPTKLAFTFRRPDFGDKTSIVTIEFSRISDQQTELKLTHELLPQDQIAERYESGWSRIMELLGNYVAAKA